ncbi:MAG: 30S ribosomal protein S8 [Candidatus Micrarchaeota archaeon]|nr:30S ribosomal protein S8 [Candidatus Micrarchaeota archaeon]MDE1864564.1 30S ribosomal protein S8 [Candidatus Micrarchaeota archaeon]
MDLLANTINTIKVNENAGLGYCTVSSTKLIRAVVEVMKRSGYISGYGEVKVGKRMMIKIVLARRINDVGIIKPRFAVALGDYQKYETRYIPSKDFGVLILSTPKGIMTNREAKEQRTGGRLLAYVY